MQTILGSGGAIGIELAKALTTYTTDIRLVSRHPEKVNETDTVFPADLTNAEAVKSAVKGSEIVYLTVGLPYDLKVWKRDWPVIMQNVIAACIEYDSKLVFFDNIYMYDGKNLDPITEDHAINPPSEKGKVRAKLVQMIWDAAQQNGLIALIARCADFYGPSVKKVSVLSQTVIEPLSKGETANLFISDRFKHSYTYTPDAGKAVALLGNAQKAYGETWHLPTAKDPLTGKEWIELVAAEMKVKPKYRCVGKMLMKVMGWFSPTMKELDEMLYQYEKDYVFNSDKFEQAFSFKPTSYKDGIKEVIAADYN